MIKAGVDQQTKTDNSYGTKASTSNTGDQQVKAGEGASLSDRASLAQDASRVYADLQGISEKAGSSASQGFKRAAGISQAASVDYTRAETARQEARDTASLTGAAAFDTLSDAAAAGERIKGQATHGVPGRGCAQHRRGQHRRSGAEQPGHAQGWQLAAGHARQRHPTRG